MLDKMLKSPSVWEKLKDADLPIVCYGTGNGADKIFDEFERLGIKISAVMASDGFVRDRSFRGFKVKSLSDCENEFGDFYCVICFGSQLKSVTDNIKSVAAKHKTFVPSVSVYGNGIANREFFERNKSRICNIYSLLADEKSKDVFFKFVNFEYSGGLDILLSCESDKEEVFSDILRLGKNEDYLDLGAYNGDTIKEFLYFSGNEYGSITAVEPAPRNFKKLMEYTKSMSNITLVNKGIWSGELTMGFARKGGRNSYLLNAAQAKTDTVSVDEISKSESITYIKADIEGAESEMLDGAEITLKRLKPKLNIAAYHRIEDIFILPEKILEVNPEYKIYFRHHPYIPGWDTNFYCV